MADGKADPEKGRGGAGKWIAVVAAVAAALLLLRLFGPGSGGGKPPVAGKVLDADGKPVPSVVVEAEFDIGRPAGPLVLRSPPTSADGGFVVPDAPKEWRSLRVRTKRGPFVIDADMGDAKPPLDIALRLSPTFVVSGLVVSAEMGHPLLDMDVRLGHRKTRTDELGRFRFPDLPAGLANLDAPVLEVTGKGRRAWKRDLSWQDPVDDLLVHMEKDGPR
jgi:hypothetical protein